MQAALIHKGKCRKRKRVPKEESRNKLGQELADVVGIALLSAHILGVDIESALEEKWLAKGREWEEEQNQKPA